MIIYNEGSLQNKHIREQAEQAYKQQSTTRQEWDNIREKFPVDFYSPNFFIRAGLFILTLIIAVFSFGLFTLLFLGSTENAIGGLAIFCALVAYAMLEYMVKSKKHFQSGVDDALLWIAAGFFFGGFSYLTKAGDISNCLLVFMISLYSWLRFADRIMSILSYLSLLGVLFFSLAKMGDAAMAILPFAMIAASFLVYLFTKKLNTLKSGLLYLDCLQAVSVAALLGLYISGNYYVVKEAGSAFLNLPANAPLPFGWVFWIFTLLIPFVYIARGIQLKNIVLIRIGLVLVAVIVFTVRYYYAVAPIEVTMTVAGIMLIVLAYMLNRYLKLARYGFTSLEIDKSEATKKRVLESLILVQTFSGKQLPGNDTEFGGGSFGGAGGSGEF